MKQILILLLGLILPCEAFSKGNVPEENLVIVEETLTNHQKKQLYKAMLTFDAGFDAIASLSISERETAEYKLREILEKKISRILSSRQIEWFRKKQNNKSPH